MPGERAYLIEMTPETQTELKHYLVRPLADQSAAVEEKLLIDEKLFEELLILEDEMIDEYLSFGKTFLSCPRTQLAIAIC